MAVACEVWLNEKTEIGGYEFDHLPRAGDTISIPNGDGFRHFRVDHVTHRAEGPKHPSGTYLFVSEAE